MNHLDNLENLLGSFRGKRILDLGSGRGGFLIDCAKKGYDAIGLELNPQKIKLSYENAKKAGVNINVIQRKVEHIPLESRAVDFVYASELIEHVESPELALKEIYRVLKIGGLAYISIHNKFAIYDTHFRTYFIRWMPKAIAEKYLGFIKRHKNYSQMVDAQRISDMHYFGYLEFKNFVKHLKFEVNEIRWTKMKNIFGRWSILLLPIYAFFILIWWSTFHFLLKK